ncbi:MAG: DUF433 domain-containing protein [Chloroflexota bacterium]
MARKEQAPDQGRIVTDPDILVGKPVVKGTRISVELVLEYLAQTPDLDELFADYPELTREDVQAVLAYARGVVEREPHPGTPRREAPARATQV